MTIGSAVVSESFFRAFAPGISACSREKNLSSPQSRKRDLAVLHGGDQAKQVLEWSEINGSIPSGSFVPAVGAIGRLCSADLALPWYIGLGRQLSCIGPSLTFYIGEKQATGNEIEKAGLYTAAPFTASRCSVFRARSRIGNPQRDALLAAQLRRRALDERPHASDRERCR